MGCFPCFDSNSREEEKLNPQNSLPPPPSSNISRLSSGVDRLKTRNNNVSLRRESSSGPKDSPDGQIAAQTFTFRELAAATNNFRPDCFLGEGGFGCVYRGRLQSSGQVVAVKQLDRNGLQGNREFLVEVLMLSLLHHPNLVSLIGYCADGDQRLLVYEFMALGSLEDHLHDHHIGSVKSEREQQIMGLLDKIGKMEADLQGAEPIKMELNQARTEAQSLLAARDELISRVQQLTEDHQRAHMDLQQVPVLVSELESLRQEYQHCRATYDYEKKLYNDHLESLQVMEKNYMTMASEVEKLRTELKKHAENDKRAAAAAPYAGFAGHNDKEASGHYPAGQNTYDDAYGVPQGRGPLPGGVAAVPTDGNTAVGAQAGPAAARAGYDAYRGSGPAGPGYDMQRGPGQAVPGYDVQRGPGFPKGPGAPAYDPQRGPSASAYDPQRPGGPYDAQRGSNAPSYDPHRGPAGPGYDSYRGPGGPAYDRQRGPPVPGYDPRRGSNTDAQRGPPYDGQRGPQFGGPGYDVHRGTSFESPQGLSGPQGQPMQQANNASFGSMAPNAHTGGGFQGAQAQPPPPPAADGNHPGRR